MKLNKENQKKKSKSFIWTKIRKAHSEASNRKLLLHRPPLKSDDKWGHMGNILGFEALKLASRFFGPDIRDGLLI